MSDEPRSTPSTGGMRWADDAGRRWSEHADRLEAMLAPIDELLLPAAAIAEGDRVLDVGCGRGVTSRAAARRAGPSGSVTGIDISDTLIDDAAALDPAQDAAPLRWITADAATHVHDQTFDVVVSRFGAIFFDDPVSAFTNLRSATRPDGRMSLAVWAPRDASEFQSLAVDVAVRVAATHGVVLDPGEPDAGPFAFGRERHSAAVLDGAGWTGITFSQHTLPLYVGGAGTTPKEAVEMARSCGPLSALLADAPDDVADAVAVELTGELQRRWDGTGVALPAAVTIIAARCP